MSQPMNICWFCVFCEGLARSLELEDDDYAKWHLHMKEVHGSREITV